MIQMKDFIINKLSAAKSLKRRHPWVFSGAVEGLDARDGDLIRLFSGREEFLGIGYYNADNIRLRILSFEDCAIDQNFWNSKFEKAFALRKGALDFESTNCFRLINAEGDFIPGLIVDVYNESAVIDFHTEGLRAFENEINIAIKNLGLEPVVIGESELEIEVKENDCKFMVYPGKGQKTGLFLDQRENRKGLQKYVEGKTVLNMFSYSGGFSIYALKAGAQRVINVDSSEFALEQAKRNYKLNGLEIDESDFVIQDGFKFLDNAKEDGLEFDVVILDPPAFVKRKDSLQRALRAYRRLNYLGMSVCSMGGLLATFSCSGHVTNDDLRRVVWQATMDALRDVQIIENPLNQFDHPVSVNSPEGEYLKGLVLKIGK